MVCMRAVKNTNGNRKNYFKARFATLLLAVSTQAGCLQTTGGYREPNSYQFAQAMNGLSEIFKTTPQAATLPMRPTYYNQLVQPQQDAYIQYLQSIQE